MTSAEAKKRKKKVVRADDEEETITFDVSESPTPSPVGVTASPAPFTITDDTALTDSPFGTPTTATTDSVDTVEDSSDIFAPSRFHIGARVGLGFSGASTGRPIAVGGITPMRTTGSRSGFLAGVAVHWRLNELFGQEFGFQSGLHYVQKGVQATMPTQQFNQFNQFPGQQQFPGQFPQQQFPGQFPQQTLISTPGTLALDYIELPILARLRVNEIGFLKELPVPLAPFFSIGPVIGFAINKSFQPSTFSAFPDPTITSTYGSFDLAIGGNLGIDGEVTDRIRAYFSIDYNYGLFDIDASSLNSYKSRWMSFNLGALYRL